MAGARYDEDDDEISGHAGDVSTRSLKIRQGGARSVTAHDVSVRQGGIGRVDAHEVAITRGGVLLATAEKLRVTAGAAGPVLAQAPAPAQPAQPAPVPVNKQVLSYAIGYDLGRDLAEQNVDVDINAVIRAVQEGFSKKAPAHPQQQMDQQLAGLQQRMIAQARAEMERVARENAGLA